MRKAVKYSWGIFTLMVKYVNSFKIAVHFTTYIDLCCPSTKRNTTTGQTVLAITGGGLI